QEFPLLIHRRLSTGHSRRTQRPKLDVVSTDLRRAKEAIARAVTRHLPVLRKSQRRLNLIEHTATAKIFEHPLAARQAESARQTIPLLAALLDFPHRGYFHNRSLARFHSVPMRDLSSRRDPLVFQFFEPFRLSISHLDRMDLLTIDAGFRFKVTHPTGRFRADSY